MQAQQMRDIHSQSNKEEELRTPTHTAEIRASNAPFVPTCDAQAKPFIPSNQNDNRQGFFTNV